MLTKLINDLINNLINTYDAANSSMPTFSAQGQAMDGYAEIHGYRETIKKIIALDKEILSLDQLAEIQGVKPMTDEQLQESLKHFPDLSEFEKPRNDES
jgi:inorganic pyrophosphatase